MKNLLILGAGGHGQVVRETAILCKSYDKISFLDDQSDMAIGKLLEFNKFKNVYSHAFVAIGNNEYRKQLVEQLIVSGFQLPVIDHPTAFIASSAVIEEGSYIGAMAVVNTNAVIEKGSILGIGSLVDHDSTVSAFSYVKASMLVEAGSIYV